MGDYVVIAGLSGAGRSQAANDFEDLGWFVIDNLPPELMPKVTELADAKGSSIDRIVLAFAGGLGVLVYGALWILLPAGEDAPLAGTRPSVQQAVAPLCRSPAPR